jgi:hypothetical protein
MLTTPSYIYLSLTQEMSLSSLHKVSQSILSEIELATFTRRTITWVVPYSEGNLERVGKLTKELPLIAQY